MNDEPVVSAGELTKTFDSFVAVENVTFDVYRGEVFGFLGPNGAGKTTTIKMLAGLLIPSSGKGSVAGFDVYTETEQIKQSIGYMSQLFSLYNDLTIEENINFFAGLYSMPQTKLDTRREWVLRISGLTDQRSRLTKDLPLGFKQRLALGCAVLHEPPILFLDEPTSGVDPMSRRNFWDLIYSLTEGGTTVFVTTHYMEEAEYCHRLALMNRGKLIALDTPAKLREKMSGPLLELVTSDGPLTVRLLKGHPVIKEVGMFGRAVHVSVQDEGQAKREIRRILASSDIRILKIDNVRASLEDVFVSLVQSEGGAVAG